MDLCIVLRSRMNSIVWMFHGIIYTLCSSCTIKWLEVIITVLQGRRKGWKEFSDNPKRCSILSSHHLPASRDEGNVKKGQEDILGSREVDFQLPPKEI